MCAANRKALKQMGVLPSTKKVKEDEKKRLLTFFNLLSRCRYLYGDHERYFKLIK